MIQVHGEKDPHTHHSDNMVASFTIDANDAEECNDATLCIGKRGELLGPDRVAGLVLGSIMGLCQEYGVPWEDVMARVPQEIREQVVHPAIQRRQAQLLSLALQTMA